jgi:nitrogen fixation/metabolism regulation signal transduction histidine kinase
MELKAGEKQVIFESRLADEPLMITADEQQMEQVLIILLRMP